MDFNHLFCDLPYFTILSLWFPGGLAYDWCVQTDTQTFWQTPSFAQCGLQTWQMKKQNKTGKHILKKKLQTCCLLPGEVKLKQQQKGSTESCGMTKSHLTLVSSLVAGFRCSSPSLIITSFTPSVAPLLWNLPPSRIKWCILRMLHNLNLLHFQLFGCK